MLYILSLYDGEALAVIEAVQDVYAFRREFCIRRVEKWPTRNGASQIVAEIGDTLSRIGAEMPITAVLVGVSGALVEEIEKEHGIEIIRICPNSDADRFDGNEWKISDATLRDEIELMLARREIAIPFGVAWAQDVALELRAGRLTSAGMAVALGCVVAERMLGRQAVECVEVLSVRR